MDGIVRRPIIHAGDDLRRTANKLIMWLFRKLFPRRGIVLLHIDRNGLAKGAWFQGDADVLVVDERDPDNRVYRLSGEASSEDILRRIGPHPLRKLVRDKGRRRGGQS